MSESKRVEMRLALREEGQFWNAYFADRNSMESYRAETGHDLLKERRA